MLALDNGNPGTAELFFAIATILAVVAALLYAVGSKPRPTGVSVIVWAPVVLSLALASLALAWWLA